MDRKKPVARLIPFGKSRKLSDRSWGAYRRQLAREVAKTGLSLTMAEKPPFYLAELPIKAVRAPDGRTDILSSDLARGGKDY